MNKRLENIRQLLNELEDEIGAGAATAADRGFSALELPLIIQEIVDDLQPLLTPYEAAFYWYLFRHSVASGGNPHLRVGQKTVRDRVVKSVRGVGGAVSQAHVKETLTGLENLGAIRKEGEPNRDGTLYRVLIPDEIEECRKFRNERAATKPQVTDAELDYYNVREDRVKVYERDEYKCRYCGKQLTRITATLDHVVPVEKDGDNSFDNLVTACLTCNSQKTNRPVGDFLAEQGR